MDSGIPYDDPLSDYRRNEREEMLVAPPVDLSYKKATTMEELAEKRAQIVRTGKAAMRTPKGHFMSSSLWLGNNLLTSMEGLQVLVNQIIEDPTYLSWLDLSFNEFDVIGDEVTIFSNLKILYLHGNNISDVNEIVKLKKLQNLKSLTLHGNPVESVPYYRGYVIHLLPQLTTLDFSAILNGDRKRALPVGFFKVIRNST